MRLTREQILNAKDIKQEEVDVPEWGGTVLVQSLSAAQRNALYGQTMDENGKVDMAALYPLLAVEGIVEPKLEKADVEMLNTKVSGALDRVCKVIMRLSGMRVEDQQVAQKNS